MLKFKNQLFAGAACGLIIASSGTALAQSASAESQPAEEGVRLEEIVVRATRTRDTDLQTTPIAVSAFSAETITNRNITNLQDLTKFTPGLEIVPIAGRGGIGSGITIRGLGTEAQDSQAAVGTYIDDVYFPATFGNVLGLLDVASVEVLRGPQGTLFGRNTLAGAIQYATNRPSDEFGGYLKSTVGNFERRAMEGAVNIPLADTLKLRVAAIHNDDGGYIEDLLKGVKRGAQKDTGVRVRALWTPTDKLTVDLKYETLSVKQNGRPAIIVGNVNPNAALVVAARLFTGVDTTGFDNSLVSNADPSKLQNAGYDYPDFFNFRHSIVQGTVSYDLTDHLTLKSISAYSYGHSLNSTDFDLTPFPIFALITPYEIDVFTQELQLSGSALDNRLNFATGVFYYDSEDVNASTPQQKLGNAPAMFPGGEGIKGAKSFAAYGQGTYNLTDQLSVSLGMRYTHERTSARIKGDPGQANFTFTDWSPHFGLQFQASDDVMLYAKASKGFRAGGFAADRRLAGGGQSFSPDTAWTYELGGRFTVANRIRINPTVFQTEWKGVQSTFFFFQNGQAFATTRNSANARIRGLELEAQAQVADGFRLDGSLALTDAKYTKIAPGFPFFTLASELRGISKTKFTVGATYDTQVNVFGEAKLTGNVNYSWRSEYQSNSLDSSTLTVPSLGLLNARLTLDFEKFTISAFGSNLTNELVVNGGFNLAFNNQGGSIVLKNSALQ